MFGKTKNVEDKPTVKTKIRKYFVMHLVRGQKREIYREDEIVWLTPREVKHYAHLIEVIE